MRVVHDWLLIAKRIAVHLLIKTAIEASKSNYLGARESENL